MLLTPCLLFLAAYRGVLPLPAADLERTAAVYGWVRAHELWLYEQLYVHGNPPVRRFVRPGRFTPVSERWAPLQRALDAGG